MKLIKFLLISTFATLLALAPVTNTFTTEHTISIAIAMEDDDEYKQYNNQTPKPRTIPKRS